VNCCNQLYEGPINLIIKSETRLISHADPGYMTIMDPKPYIYICFSYNFISPSVVKCSIFTDIFVNFFS
jgi:hypothetical protein